MFCTFCFTFFLFPVISKLGGRNRWLDVWHNLFFHQGMGNYHWPILQIKLFLHPATYQWQTPRSLSDILKFQTCSWTYLALSRLWCTVHRDSHSADSVCLHLSARNTSDHSYWCTTVWCQILVIPPWSQFAMSYLWCWLLPPSLLENTHRREDTCLAACLGFQAKKHNYNVYSKAKLR